MHDLGVEVPARFLIVTWYAGGGTMPAIGLGRVLADLGHDVRILAPPEHGPRIQAAGCSLVPFPSEALLDVSSGRALEDQPEEYFVSVMCGLGIPQTLFDELGRRPADVLVVDHQLRSASCAAEATGLPTASLVHTPFGFHGMSDDPEAWGWDFAPVNRTRIRLGLTPIEPGEERLSVELQRRCQRALVVMPAEFDPRPVKWERLVHVGPIFEEADDMSWSPPWAAEDPRPLVVVSLSSQYMHQEDLFARILNATKELPVRVLALSGLELAPEELALPENAVAAAYVPHAAVVPSADLVVSHGGMGTVMASFAAGVPMVCIPLGRDQPVNAARVESLGAGRALAPSASSDAIRTAIAGALASDSLRAGARRMADIVASYGRGARAVNELETLAESRRGDSNP